MLGSRLLVLPGALAGPRVQQRPRLDSAAAGMGECEGAFGDVYPEEMRQEMDGECPHQAERRGTKAEDRVDHSSVCTVSRLGPGRRLGSWRGWDHPALIPASTVTSEKSAFVPNSALDCPRMAAIYIDPKVALAPLWGHQVCVGECSFFLAV